MTQRRTIDDYFSGVYAVVRRLAATTEVTYRASLSCLGRWHGQAVALEEMSDTLMSAWVRFMEADGLAARTIKGKRADVLSIWRHAWEHGECRSAPNPRRIRQAPQWEDNPSAWTMEEFRRMLKAASKLPGYLRNGLKRASYFTALLAVAYETGLRRGDLLALPAKAIGSDGQVTLTQKKTGRLHVARLRNETIAAVRRLEDRLRESGEPSDRPLAWPHSFNLLYYWMQKIRIDAGIDSGALQQCRRTGATAVESVETGAAMKYLGHRSPGLAEKSYIDRRKIISVTPIPPRVP
jgi:integrase